MTTAMDFQVISNEVTYKGAIPSIQTSIRIQKLVDQSIQTEFKNIHRTHRHCLQPDMASRSTQRADRLLHTDGSLNARVRLQPYCIQSNCKSYDTTDCLTSPDAIHIGFDHNHIRRQSLGSHLYRSNQ